MEFDTIIIPRINSDSPDRMMEQWYVACTRSVTRLVIYRNLDKPFYDPINKLPCDPETYDAIFLNADGDVFNSDDVPF